MDGWKMNLKVGANCLMALEEISGISLKHVYNM